MKKDALHRGANHRGVEGTVSLSAGGRVATISDAADAAKLVSVAAGAVVDPTALAPAVPAKPANSFSMSFNGVTVTFNGIVASILYTSSIQINLKVPYEIAGTESGPSHRLCGNRTSSRWSNGSRAFSSSAGSFQSAAFR